MKMLGPYLKQYGVSGEQGEALMARFNQVGSNDEFKALLEEVKTIMTTTMIEMKEIMEKPGKPLPDMSQIFQYLEPYRAKFETAVAGEVTQPLLSIGIAQATIDKFILEIPEIMVSKEGPNIPRLMKWGEEFPETIREEASKMVMEGVMTAFKHTLDGV